MNLVIRKLVMLKNSISEKELNAKKKSYFLCTTDIELKNNIDYLINKLSLIQ